MLVQDRKTGQWYDPAKEMEKIMMTKWFRQIMLRLKAR